MNGASLPPGDAPSPTDDSGGVSLGTQPKRHWAAVVALIFGILALIGGLIPVIGVLSLIAAGPVAIIFGVITVVATRDGELRGRTMAIVAIVLAVVGMLAAVLWLLLVQRSLDNSFEDLYGSRAESNGDGRNMEAAINFGETSNYPDGLAVSAPSPVAADVPTDTASWGYQMSFAVTYVNNGPDPILFEPGGNAQIGEGSCKQVGPGASDIPAPTQLPPGQTQTIEFTVDCGPPPPDYSSPSPAASASPADLVVYLQTWPEPYGSQAWFKGPVPPEAKVDVG